MKKAISVSFAGFVLGKLKRKPGRTNSIPAARRTLKRLEIISTDLTKRIENATSTKQSEIIVNACVYAATRSQLDEPIVSVILEGFKNGNVPVCYQDELEKLTEKYDNDYFDMQEAEERGELKKGKHDVPFRKARALSAIGWCYCDDLNTASTEAVYETFMVTDDHGELYMIIEDTLNN
jgi:hypothetical protein